MPSGITRWAKSTWPEQFTTSQGDAGSCSQGGQTVEQSPALPSGPSGAIGRPGKPGRGTMLDQSLERGQNRPSRPAGQYNSRGQPSDQGPSRLAGEAGKQGEPRQRGQRSIPETSIGRGQLRQATSFPAKWAYPNYIWGLAILADSIFWPITFWVYG